MSLPKPFRAGFHLLDDANLTNISEVLGCKLKNSGAELRRMLAFGINTKQSTIDKRREICMKLRAAAIDIPWEEIASLEKDISSFFKSISSETDEIQSNSFAQLSFQGEHLRCLNHIPYAMHGMSIFKIWAVPLMTILVPLMAWMMPYLLMKFIYKLPISSDQYSVIMKFLWSGEMIPPYGNPFEKAPSLMTPRSIAQALIFAFSFAQSIYQPLQNAYYLYKMDAVMYGIGEKVLLLRKHFDALRRITISLKLPITFTDSFDDIDTSDPRRAFILLHEQPERLRMIQQSLSRFEVYDRIAMWSTLNPARFINGEAPSLKLTGAVDISLKTPVASSVELGGNSAHAIITGPNGGGKSSFMRAVLQNVLFAHTFGMAPSASLEMTPLKWIASGLRLRDSPGVYSMFETEVLFASASLRKNQPGIVLFDELFHSTNPPDGARTAQEFLTQLWERKATLSIISTHVFPLVEAAPKSVQRICCQASVDENEEIFYSYQVQPGVCRVSSVKKVWQRFHLTQTKQSKRKPRESLSDQVLLTEKK
jgi:hypothetical protein